MTLIRSISGIRGTMGGEAGQGLTPMDAVKYAAAFAATLQRGNGVHKIVVGRDARISGEMLNHVVVGTLLGCGMDVVDVGLACTPTVAIAVPSEAAVGGIILTASHNQKDWNALKLLDANGEFLSEAAGAEVLRLADIGEYGFAQTKAIGAYYFNATYLEKHVAAILALPGVDAGAIRKRNFRIVVDGINSVGGLAIPRLLRALGVENVIELYCEPNGKFQHDPEPLPENLTALSNEVINREADVGIAVDPDADRLAFVCEDGEAFGEEYTLVAIADYVLKQKVGNTVSNFSSTKALREITQQAGGQYYAAPVGEVNVVAKMREVGAIIGGEGNGGVIVPDLHYGRDALAGTALFLSHLARFGKTCSLLRSKYPDYHISKNKFALGPEVNMESLFEGIRKKYNKHSIDDQDGLRIELGDDWVHLRRSNTEPILRIYAESSSRTAAESIANKLVADIREIITGDE